MDLKLRKLTSADKQALDQSWEEVGESIAQAIVEGGKTRQWAWKIVGPLGLYRHWMLNHWIARYLEQRGDSKKKLKKQKILSDSV